MFVPNDYDHAVRWIMKSKKVSDRNVSRTMYYYGMRLVRRSTTSIAVYVPWSQHDIATYYADGTMTIELPTVTSKWSSNYQYSSLHSQGHRRIARVLSGVKDIYIRKGVGYILEQDHKFTPSKVTKCRMCSGTGKQDSNCYPNYCQRGWGKAVCPDHPNEVLSRGGWHHIPCEHGHISSHVIPNDRTCYQCNSTGKFDYGNKPIALMWDGSPIRIKDGNLYRREPSELEKRIAAYVNPSD